MLAFAPELHQILPSFPFALAERNFYRAARDGLSAELAWPRDGGPPEPVRAGDLLLPRARTALREAGVDASEIEHHTGILGARVQSGMTGAAWQSRALAALEAQGVPRPAALHKLLEAYLRQLNSGQPVHGWCDPGALVAADLP